MKDYKEIKGNFIKRFLNPLYLNTMAFNIEYIVDDMNKRSPFEIILDNNNLIVNLGDGIILNIEMDLVKNVEGYTKINKFKDD